MIDVRMIGVAAATASVLLACADVPGATPSSRDSTGAGERAGGAFAPSGALDEQQARNPVRGPQDSRRLAPHRASPAVNRPGFEYILDDGSGGFAIGPSEFDATVTWGNYFVAEPGAEWLTTIRVSFPSGMPVGSAVTLIVFDDPDDDGDPTNAAPLALASGRSAPTGPQDFVDFPVRPVRIEGGFFIAAAVRAWQRQAVARMDQDTLGVRSWLFFSEELQLDLGAAPFILRMDESPFRGTWMVRAIGEAHGCAADLDRDGAATFFDFLVFQEAFASGDLLADFDVDGELTFFDFLAFQEVFAAGC